MTEFPKCLYRAGSAIEWEGRKIDTFIVEDAEAEAKALKEGWQRVETFLEAKAEEAVVAVKKAVKRKAG